MPMMSRQEMERIVDAGGTVLMPDGTLIARRDQIPLDEAEVARRQAALDEQRKELGRRAHEAARAEAEARAKAEAGPRDEAGAKAEAPARVEAAPPERPRDEPKSAPRRP